MGINPHLIPPRMRDPGAAHAVVDLQRRMRRQEGRQGYMGGGARITGTTLTTSDTSASRVWMQGTIAPDGTDTQQAGLFATDSSGNVFMALIPGQGVQMTAFVGTSASPAPPAQYAVAWYDGSYLVGEMVASHFTDSGHHEGVLTQRSYDPTGTYEGRIYMLCRSDGTIVAGVYAGNYGSPANTVQISDQVGDGVYNGALYATAFNVTSDKELKTDIKPLDVDPQTVYNLRPVRFKFRDRDQTHYGLIADEVESHLPEIVTVKKDLNDEAVDRKSYSLPSLVTLLVATVQEQDKRIKKLEEQDGHSTE